MLELDAFICLIIECMKDLCFSHAADVETWDKMITLNLLVPMKLTHALGPSLAHSQAGGHIINISSVAGLRASKYNAAYSASKWGLTGWSKACFEVGGHPSKALQLALQEVLRPRHW